MLPAPLVIFNSVALIIVIVLATLMARWGYLFNQNSGDNPVTTKYQWRILKSLIVLMVITLFAAAVNALFVSF